MEFASISKSLLLFDTSDDIEIDEGLFRKLLNKMHVPINGLYVVVYIRICLLFFKKGEDFYSMEKLDYVYFVHSLCLIGRLLLYKDSRELFPVTLPNFDGRFNPPNIVLIISCFIKCYVVHPDQLQDLEGDFCNLICYFSNLIKS